MFTSCVPAAAANAVIVRSAAVADSELLDSSDSQSGDSIGIGGAFAAGVGGIFCVGANGDVGVGGVAAGVCEILGVGANGGVGVGGVAARVLIGDGTFEGALIAAGIIDGDRIDGGRVDEVDRSRFGLGGFMVGRSRFIGEGVGMESNGACCANGSVLVVQEGRHIICELSSGWPHVISGYDDDGSCDCSL